MILEINISFCKIIWGPRKSDKNNYYHWVKLEKSLFGQQTLLLPQANSLTCVLNLTSSHLFSDFNSASVPFLFCVINVPVFIWSFLLHTNVLFCFSSKTKTKTKLKSTFPLLWLHFPAPLYNQTPHKSWLPLFPIFSAQFLLSAFQWGFHTWLYWSTFYHHHQWALWCSMQWTMFGHLLTLLFAGFHIINQSFFFRLFLHLALRHHSLLSHFLPDMKLLYSVLGWFFLIDSTSKC